MNKTLDSVDLTDLLSRSALGDQQAFAELYKKTSPLLNALVMRIVGHTEVAQEVLQEGFIQVWQQASRFDQAKVAPMAWRTKIGRCRALDRIRHEKSQSSRIENASAEPMMSLVSDSSQHTRFSAEFEKLARCLQPISLEQRKSIILAYCYGVPHSELATQISAPIGTVKSWIRRGLQSLRKCMES